MLNELIPLPLQPSASHPERSLDPRGYKTVSTVHPTRSNLLRDRPDAPEKNSPRGQQSARRGGEAVEFRREETSLHRLYQSTKETVETSRSEKIADLRRAIQNGTYQPTLMVVAERLLSSGELGHL